MSTSFIRQQIEVGVNDLMQEVSKQLAEIVKSTVQNELHLFQQQQHREIPQIHGHSAESTHVNASEALTNNC